MKELLSLGVRALLIPARIVGRWLRPTVGRDPRIERLQWWRTSIGYAGVVALLIFRGSAAGGTAVVNGAALAPVVKAVIAIPCFMVAVAVLAARRPAGSRTSFVRQASSAWIIAILATVIPVAVVGTVAWILLPDLAATAGSSPWIYLLILFSTPLLMAALWALVIAVRYSFRASDVHPFMPAVVGVVVATVTAVYGFFETLAGETEFERWLGVAGIVGCCVSGVLSAHEFNLMRALGATWDTSYIREPRQYRGAVALSVFVILPLVVVVPIRTELREDKADLLERQAQYAAATKKSGVQRGASRSSAAAASRRTSTTKKSSKVSTTRPGITQVQPVEATVSSQAPDGTDASGQIVSYGPKYLIDGDATTAWRTSGNARGETITLSLPDRVRVRSVGLIPGYAKVDPKDAVDRFVENGRVVTVVWSGESGHPSTQKFADTRTMQRTNVDITTSVLTLKITGSIRGPRPFTAISDIVVFGSRVGG